MAQRTKSKLKPKPKQNQTSMLRKEKSAYGGDLMKKRAGRSGPRPLATRETMHLVLRSTLAKGAWSFRVARNEKLIGRIVRKFSKKYGVRILSVANVGSHLHLQIKLSNRFGYRPFIRAITGAIALGVMRGAARPDGGAKRIDAVGNRRSRNLPIRCVNDGRSESRRRFWDYRPFTRVVQSFRAFLHLKDYIRINQYEGYGYSRAEARFLMGFERPYGVGDHRSSA